MSKRKGKKRGQIQRRSRRLSTRRIVNQRNIRYDIPIIPTDNVKKEIRPRISRENTRKRNKRKNLRDSSQLVGFKTHLLLNDDLTKCQRERQMIRRDYFSFIKSNPHARSKGIKNDHQNRFTVRC